MTALARNSPVNGTEALVLDTSPITIGGFRLSGRSAVPAESSPSLKGWTSALILATATHEASPYWIGDLMKYSESREDWREKLSQAMSVTKLAEQTLKNLGYLSRRVEVHERELAPTPAHAAEVAKLERPEQTKWLGKARDEGWTVRELRGEIRHSARRTVLEGHADTMHHVEVCVWVDVEADSPYIAEDRALKAVKHALANRSEDAKPQIAGAKVVSAKARVR